MSVLECNVFEKNLKWKFVKKYGNLKIVHKKVHKISISRRNISIQNKTTVQN